MGEVLCTLHSLGAFLFFFGLLRLDCYESQNVISPKKCLQTVRYLDLPESLGRKLAGERISRLNIGKIPRPVKPKEKGLSPLNIVLLSRT